MTINPSSIIDTMMSKDSFSQWLGIERIDEAEGYCRLRMVIREDMCNGFGIAHGGICYSFADSALAFAANSLGRHALSIDTSISHFKPLKPGAIIFANTRRLSISAKVAHFEVTVENDQQELVAYFKGVVFFKDQAWEMPV
jgi:acyl-CoA thioesterase